MRYNARTQNNRVTFNCTFEGLPLPTLSWQFANGSNLPRTNQFQVFMLR